MKKYILKICIFFLIIALVDVLFGYAMETITDRIDIGGVGRNNYICDEMQDEVLVFGSSRAEYHYNAQMISDSLGVSCYNAGESGCGIILAYGRLLRILERYTPQTIIYEVTPDFDFLGGDDNHKYLNRLKQRYDVVGIDSIFWDVDPTERYKMLSGMYRNNSSFFQNLIVYFLRMSTDNGIRGFRPLSGAMDTMKIKSDRKYYDSKEGYVYDSLKIRYMDKFLDLAQGIDLVFVLSPMWYEVDSLVLEPIKQVCARRNTCLIDFSNNPKYIHNNEYFKDGTHLNAHGADVFTNDLIVELCKRGIFTNRPLNTVAIPNVLE